MARAKRTDRAEARRRYRNETAPEGFEDAADDEPSNDPTPARSSRGAASTPPRPQRVGITTAFRQSIHPVDVRSDLRALPVLVRDKALWIPIALCAATAIYHAFAPGQISFLLVQYFLWAPPIGAVFLAGFLAKRASWLLGALVGLASVVLFAALLFSGAWNTSALLSGGLGIDPAEYGTVVGQWLLLSPVMGALFAGGAAWYRRFLQLSNPNRARLAEQKRAANSRSARGGGAQKAGARR